MGIFIYKKPWRVLEDLRPRCNHFTVRKTHFLLLVTGVAAVMLLLVIHLVSSTSRSLDLAPRQQDRAEEEMGTEAITVAAIRRPRPQSSAGQENEDWDVPRNRDRGPEHVTQAVHVPARAFQAARHDSPGGGAQPKPVNHPAGEWGSYPGWWREAWGRSAVAQEEGRFVGDQPLFPACSPPAQRSWEGFGFVEPYKYLKNVTNPCWWENPRTQKSLKCVPYFYLAGVAKGGTTDLSKRLRQHPDICEGTMKEYHWWERDRYGFYDEEDPESVRMDTGSTFREYVNKVIGRDIFEVQNEVRETGSSRKVFGDFSPSYFWDPHNWYVLDGNQGCTEPRVIVGQHIRHVYPQAKILLTFRHPTSRLYSRFVSRIPRTPALRGSTPEDFHKYVVRGVELYQKCFAEWSVRHCAYNFSLFKEVMTRMVEGMYPVFMADWLRVWPRDQMLILRYEDYGGHEKERINEVLRFLGLRTLSDAEMDELMGFHVVNAGTKEYARYGLMLDKTRKILDEFYQPFITQFAEMLQDKRFLWKDVSLTMDDR